MFCFWKCRIPDGVEKFTIIGDLQGYGYCNSDLRANLAAITILQVKAIAITLPWLKLKCHKENRDE